MASPIPKTPTEVISRVFGKDPVAEILAKDAQKPYERDEQILFDQKWTAKLTHQTFGGMGGIFHLFADPTEVTLRVWFRIADEGKARTIALEKAELIFSEPHWGGEYFFYCPDSDLPAKYEIKRMLNLAKLKDGWCKQNSKRECSQAAYYEHADAGEEKWECTAVKKLELKRIVIEESGRSRPDVDADVVISARPKLLPRLNDFSYNGRDIDKVIYGAFVYAGISDWVDAHRRHNDITAVLAGFFEAFLPGRTPTAP